MASEPQNMLGKTRRPDSWSAFGLFLHHDAAERESAYDRHSAAGRLDRALAEAPRRGWTVVSMKDDWKRVFASEP